MTIEEQLLPSVQIVFMPVKYHVFNWISWFLFDWRPVPVVSPLYCLFIDQINCDGKYHRREDISLVHCKRLPEMVETQVLLFRWAGRCYPVSVGFCCCAGSTKKTSDISFWRPSIIDQYRIRPV